MRREAGMALILVMWLLALLTALLGTFAVLARGEMVQARQSLSSTQALYAAEAGLALVVQRMAHPDAMQRWVPDGRTYQAHFGEAELELVVQDESGKIDLNVADAAMLARFFLALGLAEHEALRVADVIIDWRDVDDLVSMHGAEDAEYAAAGLPYGPKNAPFETLEELQQLLDIDHALYQQASPYLTVFTAQNPDPAVAQGPVLQALGMDEATAAQMIEDRMLEDYLAQAAAPPAGPVAPGGRGGGRGLARGPDGPDPRAGGGRTGRFDPGQSGRPARGQAGRGRGAGLTGQPGRRGGLGGLTAPGMAGGGSGTYSVASIARLPDGASIELHATIRIGGPGLPGQAYSLLARREGAY